MARFDSTALRNAKVDVYNAILGANALINIRTGDPANAGGQGTLLAQLVASATFFGAAAGGVIASNAITDETSAPNSGIANHYEFTTSGGTFVESGLCDLSGTDGVSLNDTNITAGDTVSLSGPWVKTAANA